MHLSYPFPLLPEGCVVTVTGRLIFTSNKSMEIEVLVDADSLLEGERAKYRAVSAYFTYISLDKYHKALPVPPLKVGTIQASVFCVCICALIWSHSLF